MERCISKLRLQLTTDSKMLHGRIKTAGDFAWLKALEENTDRIIILFAKEPRNKHMPGEKENPAKEYLGWPW